jgi:predicted Zn finger-like uncharacterized protein
VQTSCPNCSNRLVVDDAKVPATPFMLKCPKCQGMVKLPGKGAQAAPAGAPASPAQAPPAPSASAAARPASPNGSPPQTAQAPQPSAPARPQPSPAPPSAPSPPQTMPTFTPSPPATPPANPVGKALIAFPSPELAGAVGSVLVRLGFAVDQLDSNDDKLIRLQQGDYDIVATARNGVPEERNPYRLVQLLPPEVRRRLFLLLVGDDLQTGEGSQAFALLADLVVNAKDAAQTDRLVLQALHERRRLYQTFWDVEDRKAEGRL